MHRCLATASYTESVLVFSKCLRLLVLAVCMMFAVTATYAVEENATGKQVTVVFVFDKSCRISCDMVRPLLTEIGETYKGKLRVVELDISPDVRQKTEKKAEELGYKSFLADTSDWYPAVGIFNRSGKKIKELLGAQSKKKYVDAVEKALAEK